MACLRLVTAIDAANPIIGDIWIDPLTGTDGLAPSLVEEVRQTLYTRFFMFQGEWLLNPATGLPWFQQILGVKNSLDIVASIFRQVILTCPGVVSLQKFALRQTQQRVFSLTFQAGLSSGETLTADAFRPFVITIAQPQVNQ